MSSHHQRALSPSSQHPSRPELFSVRTPTPRPPALHSTSHFQSYRESATRLPNRSNLPNLSSLDLPSSFDYSDSDDDDESLTEPSDNEDIVQSAWLSRSQHHSSGRNNNFNLPFDDPFDIRATAPTAIDLTQDSCPYTMPSSRGEKRRAPTVHVNLDDDQSHFDSSKRRRTSQAPTNKPKTVERIDLSGEDDAVASTLQKQRAEQVRSQQPVVPGSKSKLTSQQCTVCLEAPTDMTATSCGHVFCRTCLMDWLVSADKEPTRKPNCPACRKHLSLRTTQRNRKDVVPLVFMRAQAR